MSEPIFTDTTERFYAALPEYVRINDEALGWPLKSWLSGMGDELGAVDDLINRFMYVPPEDGAGYRTSDLTDPSTADAAWLPWLAQLVGIKLNTSLSVADQRTIIATSLAGAKAGTKAAIIQAAQTVLTGSKFIQLHDHSTVGNIGGATQWDILIVTNALETTSDPALAVIALGAKPAGVLLHSTTYTASWATLEASRPQWVPGWDGNTWQQIESTGL